MRPLIQEIDSAIAQSINTDTEWTSATTIRDRVKSIIPDASVLEIDGRLNLMKKNGLLRIRFVRPDGYLVSLEEYALPEHSNLSPQSIDNISENQSIAEIKQDKPKQKAYIAGPMTGYPNLNRYMFNMAHEYLKAMNYDEVLNPAEPKDMDDWPWESCMRVAISKLIKCDVAWFLPGWEASKGAMIEHDICRKIGIDIRYFKLAIDDEPQF